jgi:hypothetical protein
VIPLQTSSWLSALTISLERGLLQNQVTVETIRELKPTKVAEKAQYRFRTARANRGWTHSICGQNICARSQVSKRLMKKRQA